MVESWIIYIPIVSPVGWDAEQMLDSGARITITDGVTRRLPGIGSSAHLPLKGTVVCCTALPQDVKVRGAKSKILEAAKLIEYKEPSGRACCANGRCPHAGSHC